MRHDDCMLISNNSSLTLHRAMYYSNGVLLRSNGASFQLRNPTPSVTLPPRTTLLSVGLKDRPRLRTSGRRDFRRCEASTTPVEEPITTNNQTNEVAELSPSATKQLSRVTRALRTYGWLGFWSQLALVLVSKVVLLFSFAYTAQVQDSSRDLIKTRTLDCTSCVIVLDSYRYSSHFNILFPVYSDGGNLAENEGVFRGTTRSFRQEGVKNKCTFSHSFHNSEIPVGLEFDLASFSCFDYWSSSDHWFLAIFRWFVVSQVLEQRFNQFIHSGS